MEAARQRAPKKNQSKLKVLPGGKKGSLLARTLPAFVVVTLVGYGAIFLVYVVQLTFINQNGMKIQGLRAQVEQAKGERQELFMQVKILNSPQRIEDIALNQLGMIKPSEVEYLHLFDDKSKDNSEPKARLSRSPSPGRKTEKKTVSSTKAKPTFLGES